MNGVGTTARTGSNANDPVNNGFLGIKEVAIDIPDVDTMTRQDVDTRSEDVDDKIQFASLKSSTPSSPITSPTTSNSSPPSHRRSPVNTTSSSEDSSSFPSSYGLATSAGVSMYNPGYPRNYQFLSQPGTYYSTSSVASSNSDNEKLRKLKQKKERKENRKEKNVLNTFKVEANVSDDSYNVDKVLQSLGEPPQSEKKGSRNSNSNNKINGNKSNGPVMNGNGSHNSSNGNNNQKNRRRSNEKQIDDEDKKSTSDDEDETASESGVTSKVESSRDYSSSTVEFNHISEHPARNVVLIDDTSSEMKRQVSRSTENLSSFTKVTKKQKRKKRPQDEPPQQLPQRNGQRNGPSSSFNRGGRAFNGGSGGSSSNGENISQESISPREAATAAHAAAIRSALSQLPVKSKSPLVQSQSVDDGALKWSAALATATSSTKTDLDLAADFPPLSDGPAGSEGFVSAPVPNVWPVFKPSTSDPSAVIETTSASEHSIQQAPPDLTVQANALPADFVAVTALPDVAAQTGPSISDAATPPTPPASVCSSVQEDEPSKNVAVAPVDPNLAVAAAACEDELKTDVASYFVDNDNVEIVVSEKAYGHRDESTLPPVTIFCKGETPLEDWTSNGDFVFGYPVNEELLSMSFIETGEMASQPSTEEDDEDGLDSASALAAATSLTLNQEDNAIVSFGESLDDLKVTVSPESGICLGVCGRQQQQLDRSGRSTPQYLDSGASSWADQVEDCDNLEEDGGEVPPHQHPVKFNYQQILHYIRSSWLKVEAELAKDTIRYYQPRQTNLEDCCLSLQKS